MNDRSLRSAGARGVQHPDRGSRGRPGSRAPVRVARWIPSIRSSQWPTSGRRSADPAQATASNGPISSSPHLPTRHQNGHSINDRNHIVNSGFLLLTLPPMARTYVSPLRRGQFEATRLRIVEAVGRVLARGVTELSVPAVAEEAGVSVATVYRHFQSKQQLV